MSIPSWETVIFLLNLFDFSSIAMKISLFLSSPERMLNSVTPNSSFKIEKFLSEMAISLENCRVKQQNQSFVAN